MREPDRHKLLFEPDIRIHGLIEQKTVTDFLEGAKAARDNDSDLYVEVDTHGGDADFARRIGLEVKLFLDHTNRSAYFLGKNTIYSAGVTIMSAFPREQRFLCPNAVLLIHERRLEKTIQLNGPVRGALQIVREEVASLEIGEKLEREGFQALIAGSRWTLDALYERALQNCYMIADEAKELGLVADILD